MEILKIFTCENVPCQSPEELAEREKSLYFKEKSQYLMNTLYVIQVNQERTYSRDG